MAIQQSKKQSDLEKRLQLLRRQVYGKGSDNSEKLKIPANSENQLIRKSGIPTLRYTDIPSHSESFRTDITYLHQDLFKILIFASLAIGTEAILFLLVKNNVFTLKFF